ncbi:hypothetical protein IMY05_C2396000200 [Salix suchowensis]|nr:hypothetical protein IMY05_C2396000200 [Salix suchowensis]
MLDALNGASLCYKQYYLSSVQGLLASEHAKSSGSTAAALPQVVASNAAFICFCLRKEYQNFLPWMSSIGLPR